MAKTNFLGVKQYTKQAFDQLSNAEKIGYIHLVRDIKSGETASTEIYFGTRLYANDGGGDISKIYKILSDAGIVDASGQTVNIAELIEEATLTEGDGIVITDGAIYVDIAEGEKELVITNKGKNFLTLNDDKEMLVPGVDADAAVLQEDIQVTESFGAITNGTTLTKGTSVYDVLVRMLSKEKWSATPSYKSAFTVSTAKPTISTTQSGNLEVGTVIGYSAKTSTSSAVQFVSASTFTYGYAIGSGHTGYTTSTAYTQTLTPTLDGESKNSIKVSFSGFGSPSAVSGETGVTGTLTVASGENKITANASGLTYAPSSADTAKEIYIATNLKNYYKEDKVSDNVLSIPTIWTSASTATYGKNSNSATINGYYRWFVGGSTTKYSDMTWDSAAVRSLDLFSGFTTTKTASVTYPKGSKQEVVAVPAGMIFTAINSQGSDVTETYIKKTTVSVNCAGNSAVTKNYDIYVVEANAGIGADEPTIITLK